MGIAIMQVPSASRDGSLVRVLPDLTVAHLETWVLTHQSLKRVPRIQAVMRSLASQLADYSRTGTR
ncbi:hypothetical protein [Devosia naphthalenivorans]|uniref:hypothetical protein n=1 Tax=Devosia naphthalenivorans TaxID=2082392 RepID=UPI0024819CC5|nr:hypothetical protein [Devosia naphthalenivorans]